MRIGAPKEVFPGEARVAMTPDSALALQKLGSYVLYRGGGRAEGGVLGCGLCRCRGEHRAGCGRPLCCDRRGREGAPADGGRGRPPAPGPDPDLVLLAGPERRSSGAGEDTGRHRHRHGHGAAHLARPEDGRALLHGQHRRLPRRDRGRQPLRPLLHRPGHRRRQGAAGQGAGGRRRRRRAGRDRHRDLARRHHLCLRRAARGGRADRVHGRAVRLPRVRGGAGRGRHRRLCRALEPRVPREAARQVPRARAGDRHRHHHRPDPRPAGAEAVDGRHGRRR